MNIRHKAVFLFLAVLLLGCTTDLDPFTGPGLHVLFIGNSLTYYNDLPGTVSGIMKQAGKEMSYHSVAQPDFALVDHLDGGSDAVKQVKRGGWDFVVLQQGPSSLPESRDDLVEWTKEFDVHIRSVKARTALYMVWPDQSRLAYFDDVRVSYKIAADAVGGLFIPAGEAWQIAWQSDSTLALYAPDNLHPSPMGTFLAALVIVERLTGYDVRGLPAEVEVGGTAVDIPEATVRLLQEAAHRASARYP